MTMHMRPLSWLLVATTVATSTACATVTKPHMNQVTVASDPPLAAIMADGEPVGETPVTVPLSRHGWWGRAAAGLCSGSRRTGSCRRRSGSSVG